MVILLGGYSKEDFLKYRHIMTLAEKQITLEVLIEVPPPILTIDWERIRMFRKKLQQEAVEIYSYCNK